MSHTLTAPTYCRVHLNGEAPAIGSGRRTVFVHRIGPKWVVLRCPLTTRAARLERGEWDAIARTAKEIARPRTVKPAVTRLLKATGQKRTAAIREMCRHPGRRAR